ALTRALARVVFPLAHLAASCAPRTEGSSKKGSPEVAPPVRFRNYAQGLTHPPLRESMQQPPIPPDAPPTARVPELQSRAAARAHRALLARHSRQAGSDRSCTS